MKDIEEGELIDLLSWAFSEAERWLFDSRGKQYSDDDCHEYRAERITEILKSKGKYSALFDK